MDGRRRVGAGLLVVGLGLVAVGIVGLAAGRGGPGTSPGVTATPAVTPLAGTPSTASPTAPVAPTPSPSPTPLPSPTVDRAALVTAFLDQLVAAIRSGTVASLHGRLHPAVIARYGADRCGAELATRSTDASYAIGVIQVQPPAPWPYETDGLSTLIADAITVRARVTTQGTTAERDLHLAIVGGTVRWFTDCGIPTPASPAP